MEVTGNLQIKTSLFDKGVRKDKYSLFLSWTYPRSYWDVVGTHLPVALVTGIALFLSNWVSNNLLPLKYCTFLKLTDYPGPFCGFTRSFSAMSEGDWAFAVNNSPLACLVYIATALVFSWNTTGLLVGVKIERGRSLRLRPGWARWATVIITVLLILNWLYRLSFG